MLKRLAAWKTSLAAANAALFADGTRRLRSWVVPSDFALRLELGAMELDALPETLIEQRWAGLDPGALAFPALEDLEGTLFLHVKRALVIGGGNTAGATRSFGFFTGASASRARTRRSPSPTRTASVAMPRKVKCGMPGIAANATQSPATTKSALC